MGPAANQQSSKPALRRVRFWYALLMVIFAIFFVRLFYLQIIKHDYYHKSALSDQLKEYEIPASRGVIKAYEGDQLVPLVLNQKLYTIYADPTLVKDTDKAAKTLSSALGGSAGEYEQKLKTEDTRYVVLGRKVEEEKKDEILKHKYPGIGAQEQEYRIYPNGAMASQLLGFVDTEGKGRYGIEQALNSQLSGAPGQLKAVTDVHGVPLAAKTENTLVEPKPGEDVVLTIDIAMQKQLEDILKAGLDRAKSESGSAIIFDPNSGAVKAMANWPTYDPANYASVEDDSLFNNAAVSAPLEVGSVMKPLTVAAALDRGVVQPDSTFYDPSSYKIDDYTVKNIEEDGGPGVKSIRAILDLSLNTGATWLLMKMGGSNDQITKQGREVWHEYMTKHYMFGKATGIEQGYEEDGYVPDPNEGYGRNLAYANTSFGQAMTATPLQMAAAFSAVVNGGTYYKPRLIDATISADGRLHQKKPEVVRQHAVSPGVSDALRPMLEYVISTHRFERKFDQKSYAVGGKTGTAQIAKPEGGYFENDYNGTYLGFVGGDKPQYVIAVRVNKPKIPGYAGSRAAQPLFGDIAHMLIDNFSVTPKRQ